MFVTKHGTVFGRFLKNVSNYCGVNSEVSCVVYYEHISGLKWPHVSKNQCCASS